MRIGAMSAHGCLEPCPICKRGCPICNPCKPHYSPVTWAGQPAIARLPVKCDLCGSTAIDHTEMNCQMNRLAKDKKEANT
jgi:hypothetical protein